MNLGPLPMGNDLTRLQTRFDGHRDALAAAEGAPGDPWGPRRPNGQAW